MNVLHVLHECLTAQEELVADGTGRGVGATDQGGMMLQDVHSQLGLLDMNMTIGSSHKYKSILHLYILLYIVSVNTAWFS